MDQQAVDLLLKTVISMFSLILDFWMKVLNIVGVIKNIEQKSLQIFSEEKKDLENVTAPNKTELNIEECLDDLVDGFESSISLNIIGDDDTESEDTMKLLQKTDVLKTRESTPSKLRTESIVDRIKNSLSPAPGRQIKGETLKLKQCFFKNQI